MRRKDLGPGPRNQDHWPKADFVSQYLTIFSNLEKSSETENQINYYRAGA